MDASTDKSAGSARGPGGLSVLDLAVVADGSGHRSGARGVHRARPGGGISRLPPLLGGRAPQHARHRQFGDRGPDRPHRGRHDLDPGGFGRDHAAQPRPACGGRAVRHPGGAASAVASISASDGRRAPIRSPRWRCDAHPRPQRRRLPPTTRRAPGLLHRRRFPTPIRFAPSPPSPATANQPELWLLGSSGFSAQLAGLLGLPFSFAHHFSAGNTLPALDLYRSSFRPSATLAEPHAMVAVSVICADTDDRAQFLAGPSRLAFVRLRSGRPGRLPSPQEAADHEYSPAEQLMLDSRTTGADRGRPRDRAPRAGDAQTRDPSRRIDDHGDDPRLPRPGPVLRARGGRRSRSGGLSSRTQPTHSASGHRLLELTDIGSSSGR